MVFHNLRNYDNHFSMQNIGEVAEKAGLKLTVIPNNMERYLSFILGNKLKFIHSFQFLPSGLGKLVGNLPEG